MYKTYAITVRPRAGITDDQVDRLSTWIRKQCEYYHVVTEKKDEQRHLHAALFLKTSKERKNVISMLLNQMKDLDGEERTVLRKGVKLMYNMDYIDNYLDKDDETVKVISNLPDKYLGFPEKEDSLDRKADPYYAKLEKLWYEHQHTGVEVCGQTCRDFLYDLMYNKRLIRIIADDKRIMQVARHLMRYLKKATVCNLEVPPWEARLETTSVDGWS